MSNILDLTVTRKALAYRVARTFFGKTDTKERNIIDIAPDGNDREGIVSALAGLRDKYRIREVRVYLPFSLCLHAILDLPLKRKKDIDGALAFELEKVLPLPVEEYLYAYRIVRRDEASSRMLVLCVKRDFLLRIVDLVEAAGMSVRTARCAFMETLSLVGSQRGLKDFLVVEPEGGEVNIAVFRDGICSALKRLNEPALLGTEIESLRQAYGTSEVVLAGDVTDDIRMAAGVSPEVLHIETEPPRRGTSFLFELLPREKRREGLRLRAVHVRIALAASVAMLLAGFFLPIYRDYARLNDVDRRIAEIKGNATELLDRKKSLEQGRDRIKFLEKIRLVKDLPVTVLAELTALLPGDVWVVGFSVDEKGFVEIKGFAGNPSQLVELLERSDLFKNVGFSAPILKSGEKSRYSIKMEIER